MKNINITKIHILETRGEIILDNIEIYEKLENKMKNSEIKTNEDMSKHTSFKVGGKADIFIKINDIQDLKYILDFTKKNNIPLTIIGNGSNVLVKDNGIRGITIYLNFDDIQIDEEQNGEVIVTVGSGVKLAMLAVILQKKGIAGFEFASGIPGTIGGAIRMNAGAYGKEMKEVVENVTYIDEEGNKHKLENEQMDFSYRHSRFKEKQEIIIEAQLKFQKEDAEKIKERMDEYRKARMEKQPINMPSAGSTFKRGTNYISAKLIDDAGLKGYEIGGAQVSEKHAGFIVNKGNATAQDILDLIDYVIKVVYEKFGKILELEVEVIGE